jgi:hypothetical protein
MLEDRRYRFEKISGKVEYISMVPVRKGQLSQPGFPPRSEAPILHCKDIKMSSERRTVATRALLLQSKLVRWAKVYGIALSRRHVSPAAEDQRIATPVNPAIAQRRSRSTFILARRFCSQISSSAHLHTGQN